MQKKSKQHKQTPMERQYQEIKSRHKDKVVLFRLGDFYEMFEEDAKTAARILNIALTSRHDKPMCGFPHHAANQYIAKLVKEGKKVAVCEQVEDPAKAKGIVKRDIVKVITPGTLVDEDYITSQQNNYLCVIYGSGSHQQAALSFVDISTGEFFILNAEKEDKYRVVQDELARFSPSEIIFNEKLLNDRIFFKLIENIGVLHQSFPEWYFDKSMTDEDWIDLVQIEEGILSVPEMKKSINAAFQYLHETQFSALKNIRQVNLLKKDDFVEIDDFTIRNLELVKNMQDGSRKFTLLEVMDETITPMGCRLLRRWLVMPLKNVQRIYDRLNRVEVFYEDSILTGEVREILKLVSDIDRLTTRIALNRALPKDLSALKNSLGQAIRLRESLIPYDSLKEIAEMIPVLFDELNLIQSALRDNPSNSFGGEVIREGYHEELDKLNRMLREGKDYILQLQQRERKRTGIHSLKVKYNKIFGYFIEISKANLKSVPEDYIRKQSLVNSERFTIPELSDYEMQVTTAGEKVLNLEEELFHELVEKIGTRVPELQLTASIIAEIDVYSCFAQISRQNQYVKPYVDTEHYMEINNGRHPVVEKHMGFNLFVPNDTRLDDEENRILIITGPNMAGKSTYLRQNALIAIIAQMGCYVPASNAHIGVVDKIFTRIGASDQLSTGRSTFLMEMEEAANILANSTSKSLIIMDELGRGTSTFDGLSIAWAVIEFLHEHPERCGKTLFATHYHELTLLGEKKGVKNYNIAVKEYEEELIFLRKVVEGPADKSYGIYVAKLAGIPKEIIERARLILDNLETEGNKARDKIERNFDKKYRKKKAASELQLFPENTYDNTVEKIKNIDLNRITPLEAITFLSEIQKELGK